MAKCPTKLTFTHNGKVISETEAIRIVNEKLNGKKDSEMAGLVREKKQIKEVRITEEIVEIPQEELEDRVLTVLKILIEMSKL